MIFLTLYSLFVLYSLLHIKFSLKSVSANSLIVVLSASSKEITKFRLKTAEKIYKSLKGKKALVVCGRDLSPYMVSYMKNRGVAEVIQQNKSTNTLEDALFLKSILGVDDFKYLVLVTSLSHQRRAFNTFRNVFPRITIINKPAWGELLSWYSPFLPTGILASLINTFKDLKYNRM